MLLIVEDIFAPVEDSLLSKWLCAFYIWVFKYVRIELNICIEALLSGFMILHILVYSLI